MKGFLKNWKRLVRNSKSTKKRRGRRIIKTTAEGEVPKSTEAEDEEVNQYLKELGTSAEAAGAAPAAPAEETREATETVTNSEEKDPNEQNAIAEQRIETEGTQELLTAQAQKAEPATTNHEVGNQVSV
ncbi:hypothetical protein STCU_12339 [Strigomonas culicis]|uniref:Uncharacterized protein n=1 Tax=Strigomonas culicis TaxID=28005 RepID=S9TFN3_9TRYP|nr:hypothetical protein STCU_12339 [Strigomonas culicis]|eukprot:EPY15113.1 hypothetical protein STCU_12339 [Strigomonas culicis]